MQLLLLVFFTSILVACSRPDIPEIEKGFRLNKSDFIQLVEMTREDNPTKNCLSIGTDRIGPYWKSGDYWTGKLQLSEVLEKVSISEERYKSYLNLLNKTQTERVTQCNQYSSFLRFRSGIMVSGCLVKINWIPIRPKHWSPLNKNDFIEYVEFEDNWSLEYSCS